jgi:hypothetical protein
MPALLNFPKGTLFNRACIAGAVSGAYLGIDAIPPAWVRQIEKSDYLADLAMRLEAKRELIDVKQQ